MNMIDGNRRRLHCRAGEVVHVEVTSDGTVHNVSLVLNDQPFHGNSFTVNGRTSLLIMGVFSNATGGRYDIKLTGDPGGEVVQDAIVQDVGGETVTEDARGYIFTI